MEILQYIYEDSITEVMKLIAKPMHKNAPTYFPRNLFSMKTKIQAHALIKEFLVVSYTAMLGKKQKKKFPIAY